MLNTFNTCLKFIKNHKKLFKETFELSSRVSNNKSIELINKISSIFHKVNFPILLLSAYFLSLYHSNYMLLCYNIGITLLRLGILFFVYIVINKIAFLRILGEMWFRGWFWGRVPKSPQKMISGSRSQIRIFWSVPKIRKKRILERKSKILKFFFYYFLFSFLFFSFFFFIFFLFFFLPFFLFYAFLFF